MSNTYMTAIDLDEYEKRADKIWGDLSPQEQEFRKQEAAKLLDQHMQWGDGMTLEEQTALTKEIKETVRALNQLVEKAARNGMQVTYRQESMCEIGRVEFLLLEVKISKEM